MKSFISTTSYAVINYITALLLLTSPWLFGFVHVGGASLFLPLLFGWYQLIMAIFANNKLGFLKVFPMQMHFVLDVILGSFLMCSPWVYNYANEHHLFLPQLILGGVLVLGGVFTHGSQFTNRTEHEARAWHHFN
jgi:hypothetical protein